jgi:C-terminal processing protease CtpA/Prc
MQHTKSFLPALLLVLFFSACKKEESLQPNNLTPTTPTATTSPEDKLKDSTLLYTKDIYLWSDKIPATFNARSYADPAAIMTAIRQYATEPGFTSSVDRWSFAMKQHEWDNISSGVSEDFGITVFFRQEGDLRVRAVEKASPAGIAGIRRGWRITGIAGNNNITTANSNFIVQNVYRSKTTSFTFEKPDGSTVNLSLTAGTYQEHPVLFDSVYNVNSRKVGYLVFNSFLGDTADIYRNFDRTFNRFTGEGVQDVVVDLRYNGGGYVTVAQKLANYLAPAAANGGVMMTQKFNAKYTSYNSTKTFRKIGPLNLNRIFFIVGSGTASASELLINSLKPYMDVILLGPSKTHGKPAGYFPIPVGDWYIFPVSFVTVNKSGEGNYYNGFSLNNQVADGLDKDWGDLSESAFASAVKFISTGAFRLAEGKPAYAGSAKQQGCDFGQRCAG